MVLAENSSADKNFWLIFLAKPSGFLMTKWQNKPPENPRAHPKLKILRDKFQQNTQKNAHLREFCFLAPPLAPQFESCLRWKLLLIESFCQDSNSGGGGSGGPERLPDFLRPPGTAAFSRGLFWYLVIKNPDGLARKSSTESPFPAVGWARAQH